MTDNEIVKTLECLCGNALICRECPYSPRYKFPLCQRQVAKDALALIARQKEDIERLEKHELREAMKFNAKTISSVRAEAIKEFAYRLRQRSYESSDWSHGEHPMVVEWSDIDEVLEEMAGEINA